VVRTTVSSLPACVQRALAPQLRGVAITASPALGPGYAGIATPDGLIVVVITPTDSLKLDLLHELGHQVDDAVDAETPALERAVRNDFAHLPRNVRKELSYYSDPPEAFAEFFAERYDPDYAKYGERDLDKLVCTRRVVDEEIDRLEDCRQKFR
jgi:hypothetical protein